MANKEKREYEELKSLLYQGTITQYGKRKLIEIFETQQKEIEELKDRNKELNEAIDEWINGERILFNCVSKDKIKAKIEEVKKLIIGDENSTTDRIVNWFINQLQSLLEKE